MLPIHYIEEGEEHYPEPFRHLYQPPKGFYAQGDLSGLKTRPTLSIVGTRRVSAYGREVTSRLARQAAKQGIAIISGLALGVDSIAHRAALDAGGYTVAVLPGGLDRIHPRSHQRLADEILASGGAIISEYGLGEPALKHQFIERSRLVAGLGDVLLVTEAALKSGTMHTVGFASSLGKAVLSVPGNITSQTSVGTNNLLKDGAIAVTEINDILLALGLSTTSQQQLPIGKDPAESTLLKLIHGGVTDINLLQTQSTLTPQLFNQTLTMLELTGKIRSLGGGQWGLT